MLPFHEVALKYKEQDAQAAAEGRAVDEIPPHALLRKADSKMSGMSGQEEEKKLGESKSVPLSVSDSSKTDTSAIKSLDMDDLF